MVKKERPWTLHTAALRKDAERARSLLGAGADVDEREVGLTPLESALASCTNAELVRLPEFVKVLLDAGATRTPAMTGFVELLGKRFEFFRDEFAPECVGEASAALGSLYETFGVTPVPRRRMHDGVQPIAVTSTTWQAQHDELWDLLVPPSGPAKTVQGEVTRIAGRISDEWYRNGGANWDDDYARMAAALKDYVQRGTPLPLQGVAEIASIVRSLVDDDGERDERLTELCVAWVLLNPQPLPLEQPSYDR